MKWFSFLILFSLFLFSCDEKKKKIDPKYDPSQYERIDVNFYRGKTDGKIYIRTGELTMVKDSGNKIVYYYKEVKELDLDTYKPCEQGGYYAMDKNHVYTWQLTTGGEDLTILEGADPKTFRSFAHHWGKDTNSVYFERTRLSNLNPASIQPVCTDWNADSTTLYIKYIRDDSHLYYQDIPVKMVPGIDITRLSCKDDLMGNSFLESQGKLYILRNGQMELYQ